MNSPDGATTPSLTEQPATIGERMIHLPTGTQFRVLCSCASSTPREHTKRAVDQNPSLYERPSPNAHP